MGIFFEEEIEMRKKQWKDRPLYPLKYAWENSKVVKPVKGEELLERKMCINNSIDMMIYKNLLYVEGWYKSSKLGLWMYHAWNKERDTDTYLEYTVSDPDEFLYKGIYIPSELVIMAAENKYWELCVGVIQTMGYFSDKELIKAKEILSAPYKNKEL